MINYKIYIGSNSLNLNLDPNMKLMDLRRQLSGYANSNFRFINYQSTGSYYTDIIVGTQDEVYTPVRGIIGRHNQVYLTDITATKQTDFVGFRANWFYDRGMGCRVSLNNEPAAQSVNSGKFPPIMLSKVKIVNPQLTGVGAMENVVICEKGSAVRFGITSNGAIGYGYDIRPERGTPITEQPLYITFKNCNSSNHSNTSLQKYYVPSNGTVNGKLITVIPTSSLNINTPSRSRSVAYMKITIKTWAVQQYSRSDGKIASCDPNWNGINEKNPFEVIAAEAKGAFNVLGKEINRQLAPVNIGRSAKVVINPGGGVNPATTSPGGQNSGQHFNGPIHGIKENKSPNGIYGQVVFYLFAFNTHRDAMSFFESIN